MGVGGRGTMLIGQLKPLSSTWHDRMARYARHRCVCALLTYDQQWHPSGGRYATAAEAPPERRPLERLPVSYGLGCGGPTPAYAPSAMSENGNRGRGTARGLAVPEIARDAVSPTVDCAAGE